MNEKAEKSGEAAEEKKCTQNPFDKPFAVTKYDLRNFANMMNAMARAAGLYEINPEPQERILLFRVCDLKIFDEIDFIENESGYEPEITGCDITPKDLIRGQQYCLCNDTDDRMHVIFKGDEIKPGDFYINPGATVLISVVGEIILNKKPDTQWYAYEIHRVKDDTEELCSGTSGPGMKVEDPPPG